MPNKSLSRSSLLSFQKYSSLLAGNDPYIPFTSDYELLATEIFPNSTTADSVTFSGLVSAYGADYQHLQIRAVTQGTRTDGTMEMYLKVNSIVSYRYHHLLGNGSTVTSSSGSYSSSFIGNTTTVQTGANVFTAAIYDILDWNETTKNTTIRQMIGSTGISQIRLSSHLINDTAAIDSITIELQPGGYYFKQGTRFSLYGLKGA